MIGFAHEFLRKFSLDRDEGFAGSVARRFREAPAKICCRVIGEWIDKKLLDFGWTQADLADRIGVDRSSVTKWTAGGAISLGHLVLVLLEFQCDFADLPLPARRELALEGYLAALSHVKARIDASNGLEPLDRERFWCLFHLFSEPFWEQAIRKKDRELVKKEVERVLRRRKNHSASSPGGLSKSRICGLWCRSGAPPGLFASKSYREGGRSNDYKAGDDGRVPVRQTG